MTGFIAEQLVGQVDGRVLHQDDEAESDLRLTARSDPEVFLAQTLRSEGVLFLVVRGVVRDDDDVVVAIPWSIDHVLYIERRDVTPIDLLPELCHLSCAWLGHLTPHHQLAVRSSSLIGRPPTPDSLASNNTVRSNSSIPEKLQNLKTNPIVAATKSYQVLVDL